MKHILSLALLIPLSAQVVVIKHKAGGGGVPLAVDSQMPSGVGVFSQITGPPWTWSFTNTAGTVLYLFFYSDSNPTSIAATYNGVSMTNLGNVGPDNNTQTSGVITLFRLLNPATGANNFSISWTGASGAFDRIAGAISFTGNNGTTPDSGTATTANDGGSFSSSAFPVTVPSTTSGNIVIMAACYGDPAESSVSGTLSYKKDVDSAGAGNNQTGQYTVSSGGNVTMTVNGTTATAWATIAIEVKK